MNKDLHFESNASLLASLLGIPAQNLSCQKLSDILYAPPIHKGNRGKKSFQNLRHKRDRPANHGRTAPQKPNF